MKNTHLDQAARDLADELAKRDDPCSNREVQLALIRVAYEVRRGKSLRDALIAQLVEPLEGQIRSRAAELMREV